MTLNLAWIFFSYILGSIPFGYIIARFSGKNVLEIGWKKTSGSNVFKNVGKLQGTLSGLLDVAKGFLAVYGAQQLGLPLEVQALSGVAAVTGHNWSLFLKFAGGRGIGTFIGAFLALSPQLLGISIIPLLLFALIWNASIGTILFLILAIISAIYFNQFEAIGTLTIVSLIPIAIKRLSPIHELRKAPNKASLFKSRIIFDNDEGFKGFRITKIIKKIQGKTNGSAKFNNVTKKMASPFLASSKAALKGARFGVDMAKKPIGPVKGIISNGVKFIMGAPEKVVTEIKVDDFKKMMLAASKKIVLHQEEINRINVFPVADKDTGYNLAATLLGVEGTISRKEYKNFRDLTDDIKDAAMTNARGNAGMIYTGYLIKLLDGIKHLESIDSFHLALAMKNSIKSARLSIAEPVEGTILDIVKASGEKAYEVAKKQKEKNIIKVLEIALQSSQVALKETKEKLEVLKENNVVDAGGLGLVKILEAWTESLKGLTPSSEIEKTQTPLMQETDEKLKYPYEVVASFKKKNGFDLTETKDKLSSLGDSIEVIESENKVKLHIHTDQPEAVKEEIGSFPEAEFKVENMEEQMKRAKKKPLGLVVDQVADLPKDFLEKFGIEEVPFKINWPNHEVNSLEDLYLKMKEAAEKGERLPVVSQATAFDFFPCYQKAFKKFEKFIVITVSARISGTYSSARIARSMFKKSEKTNIFVFNSMTAETGEGLLAIKAQELISQGKNLEEIVEELKTFCLKIKLLGTLENLNYIARTGRVKLPLTLAKTISFIQKAGVKPLIEVRGGKIRFRGIRFGKDAAKILADEVKRQAGDKEIRVAIAHAENQTAALNLKKALEKRPKTKVLFTSLVSPMVGLGAGPGALIVSFHSVDPPPILP